ncbi:hypothetical protein PRO82_002255, partial [Candidatus Protochlamydia amoebophila]|nr:hypothetical protein [Candidatus Protochlamydia amoebophila]
MGSFANLSRSKKTAIYFFYLDVFIENSLGFDLLLQFPDHAHFSAIKNQLFIFSLDWHVNCTVGGKKGV